MTGETDLNHQDTKTPSFDFQHSLCLGDLVVKKVADKNFSTRF